MNVLLLARSFDIGGQGHRIKQALEKAGHSARSLATDSYHQFPGEPLAKGRSLDALYQWADVIHARSDFVLYDALAARNGPKPVVVHHHGSKFRDNPLRYVRQQRERRAIGIVSTLDLYLLAPNEVTWLPAPYDLEMLSGERPAGQRRS